MLIAKGIELREDMSMKHGLVVGSTGSGKSVSLQLLAENFSKQGVPCVLIDCKGDLGGIEFPGEENEKIEERIKQIGIKNFTFAGNPVRHLDVYGMAGARMQTTVSAMGALLIGRLLNLSEPQAGSLLQIFSIAKDHGIKLKDLGDLFSMATTIMNDSDGFAQKYGRISTTSFGALQRSILTLKEGGNDILFTKENAFNIEDLFCQDTRGHGIVNIINAVKLIQNPKIFAAYMMWLLTELYNHLPEIGSVTVPKLAVLLDESHLIFSDCPKILLNTIQKTVRLIRSRGVALFFSTQEPGSIPHTILSQLSTRIIHNLRAYSPKELKVVKTIADTFRQDGSFNVQEAILNLKIGEALVSVLDEEGAPTFVTKSLIMPPRSRIGSGTPFQNITQDNSIRNINFYPLADNNSDKSEIEFLEKVIKKEKNIFCNEDTAMEAADEKGNAAILFHIPKKIYDEYLKTLSRRGLKRQAYNAKLFLRTIEEEIEQNR